MEMAIAQQLMEWRPLYDPASQREILKISTLAATDDPGLTDTLVPESTDEVTSSKQKAMVSMGTLMLGLPVQFGATDNRIEVTETLLKEMALVVNNIQQSGGMAKPEQLPGLQMVAQTIDQQIQIIGQDKAQQQKAKQYADVLGKLMNLVKGFAQRLAAQMKEAQANGQGGMDPKDMAKIQAIMLQAKVKAENASQSHAQRTAQRQVQWEAEEKRKQQEHQLDLAKGVRSHRAELVAHDIKTAAEIRRERAKAKNEAKTKTTTE